MQLRALAAVSLLISAPLLFAGDLYDTLKTSPETVQTPSFEPYDGLQPPADNGFGEYWAKASLAAQFRVLDGGEDYLPEYVNVNEELPYRYRKLIEDSIYLQVFMISAVGVLVVLPESISHWDMNALEEKSLQDRWQEHVQTKPVWDGDDWAINYVGHPVSGAIYYTMARDDGMSIFESAAYATLMSTFFWEYGYEAFAEIPSIQDLIVTPLIGSIMGEGMHILEIKLDKNGGMIWGSSALGNISYFLLNPMGNIANGMSDLLKSYNRGLKATMTLQSYPRADDITQFRFGDTANETVRFQDRDYGFIITIR